jgi:hypothetical protein
MPLQMGKSNGKMAATDFVRWSRRALQKIAEVSPKGMRRHVIYLSKSRDKPLDVQNNPFPPRERNRSAGSFWDERKFQLIPFER